MFFTCTRCSQVIQDYSHAVEGKPTPGWTSPTRRWIHLNCINAVDMLDDDRLFKAWVIRKLQKLG